MASTGVLKNEKSVLTPTQRKRLQQARKTYDQPVMIVNEDEARTAEQGKKSGTKTWILMQRMFGISGGRQPKIHLGCHGGKGGEQVATRHEFYPKGNPLWEQYSTKAVAQTLKTYSKFTVDYPYPVAISVHTKWIGMGTQ